ncbi:MAG: LysE family translocator [Pseudomonadota bacterium]
MTLNLAIGPLALFSLVGSITPGPNNLMLMRSGAKFGMRRSVGHAVGVQIGFLGLMLLSWLGVGAVLIAFPAAFIVLRWLCFAYLMWLAWVVLQDGRLPDSARDLARPTAAQSSPVQTRPMSCAEAIAFQLINPKAWMMTVTVVSAFYGGIAPRFMDVAAATMICMAIGIVCMTIWTAWGASLHHLLEQPRSRKLFSYSMAALVVASALWILR